MRIQPLYDLQQEINRLFIAGSKFAKGDPRLIKHIDIFNKLGEKAPVFKKLATDINELTQADSQHSAEKLIAISTLLYSILYTQGETTEEQDSEKPIESLLNLETINTEYSYIQLKPVIEALSISNSGRLEIIKDANERGIFNDFRTFQYLNFALSDKYSELTDYIENHIIPNIGQPMIPILLQSFLYEDKTEQQRRMRLLYMLGYEGISDMIDKILEENLPNLQAEAVKILSNNLENEEIIIKLADDKNKIVREAAYSGLAKLSTKTSIEKLKEAYINNKRKSDLQAIINAISETKTLFFFDEILNQTKKIYQNLISLVKDKTDEKTLQKSLDDFEIALLTLKNKEHEEAYNFLFQILINQDYSNLIKSNKQLVTNDAISVTHAIVECIKSFKNNEKITSWYDNVTKNMPEVEWKKPIWDAYFDECIKQDYPKEKIFDLFIEVFIKRIIFVSTLYRQTDKDAYYKTIRPILSIEKIDPRWLPELYKIFSESDLRNNWNSEFCKALFILDAFTTKDNKQFNNLLIEITEKLKPSRISIEAFVLIIEREIKNKFEVIFNSISNLSKNSSYYDIYKLSNRNFWNQFPKEYAIKAEELYTKKQIPIFKQIAEEIIGSFNQSQN